MSIRRRDAMSMVLYSRDGRVAGSRRVDCGGGGYVVGVREGIGETEPLRHSPVQ